MLTCHNFRNGMFRFNFYTQTLEAKNFLCSSGLYECEDYYNGELSLRKVLVMIATNRTLIIGVGKEIWIMGMLVLTEFDCEGTIAIL